MSQKNIIETGNSYGIKTDIPSYPPPAGSTSGPGGSTSTLKDAMHKAVREAERAAHAYAADCEIGEERTWAFEVFERIRLATRR
ncbi:MAG: hypothetical protein AB2777_21510 [Candidatus Thiodiazotropha endolucinida]